MLHVERIDDSPVGPLAVVAGPAGLSAILLGHRKLLERARESSASEVEERSTDATRKAVRAVQAYLDGDEAPLATLRTDVRVGTAFQREVWRAVRDIPRGHAASYGDVAASVGRPGAARAIGGAVGRNPLPLLVPCHRVLAAGGKLGGFGGGSGCGLDFKRALLELEGTPWIE